MNPGQNAEPKAFRLGEFDVEPGRNLLIRDGVSHTIEPRIMDVLCALAAQPGDVISRDALIDQIWQIEFGADESLTQAISILRRTFREAGASEDYIETIPKRGYRLAMPVSGAAAELVPPMIAGGNRWLKPLMGLIAVLLVGAILVRFWPQPDVPAANGIVTIDDSVPEWSLAVLPFTDMSPTGDQAYFSDGLSEELLNALARVDGLKVASRTSSFAFKGRDIGMPEIARELGVRHVLEGSVRKSGNRLRINAQFIDAQTDQPLWSQSFDRTLTTDNIFAIQDEISTAIVGQLISVFGGNDMVAPHNAVPDTQDFSAYELFLQGRELFHIRSVENLFQSIDVLEQAVALDPEFARAWELLSASYVMLARFEHGRDYYALAVRASDEALNRNPDLALAYTVRARAMLFPQFNAGIEIDWDTIMANYNLAIEKDPYNSYVFMWRAGTYINFGYFDLAEADLERCLQIDPDNYVCQQHLAAVYLVTDRADAALQMYEKGVGDGTLWPDFRFVTIYAARGERAAVEFILQSRFRLAGGEAFIAPVANALLDPDAREASRLEVERLLAATDTVIPPRMLNSIYFAVGEYDKMVHRASIIYMWDQWTLDYSDSPERKQRFRKLGNDKYWREHGFPPQCRPLGDDDFECD